MYTWLQHGRAWKVQRMMASAAEAWLCHSQPVGLWMSQLTSLSQFLPPEIPHLTSHDMRKLLKHMFSQIQVLLG